MSRQNNHLHSEHAMSHAQSFLFAYLTSSAHSTRTPVQTSLLFPSHGDDHCDDPRPGATFGRSVESNTLTSCDPNDLVELSNTEVTPKIFHRSSVTSTYDSAESIAAHPPESDLDDEQIRTMLDSPLCLQERSKCRPSTTLSLLQRKLCQTHHVSEQAR